MDKDDIIKKAIEGSTPVGYDTDNPGPLVFMVNEYGSEFMEKNGRPLTNEELLVVLIKLIFALDQVHWLSLSETHSSKIYNNNSFKN